MVNDSRDACDETRHKLISLLVKLTTRSETILPGSLWIRGESNCPSIMHSIILIFIFHGNFSPSFLSCTTIVSLYCN